MNKLLEGKTALITGGSRGIGKAIATLFLQEGATVIICGKQAQHGEAAVAELQQLHPQGKCAFKQIDIADACQVQQMMEQVYQEYSHIDVLVNNAGITQDSLLMKMSLEQWDQVIDTNLSSLFYMTKAVIRPMLKQKQGKIINITSIVGLSGNAGQTNYSAAKAGMIGFTKSLALEVASRGICVNCIAPGWIRTDMTKDLIAQDEAAIVERSRIPLQRIGEGKDIAHAALFLASYLSDYVTGQTLIVDGGLNMR